MFRLLLIYSITLIFEEVGEAMGGGTLYVTDLLMRDDVVGMEADKSEGVKITPLIPNMYESIRYLGETTYPTWKVEKGPICESVDINAEDGTPEIISDYYEHVISTVSRFPCTGFSGKYKAFLEAPNAYVNWDAIPSRTRIDAFFDDASTYKEATETIEMDGNYPIGFKSNATAMTISSLLSRAVVYNTGSRFNLRPFHLFRLSGVKRPLVRYPNC